MCTRHDARERKGSIEQRGESKGQSGCREGVSQPHVPMCAAVCAARHMGQDDESDKLRHEMHIL